MQDVWKWPTAHVEKWVGHCKGFIACKGHYFETESVPKPQESISNPVIFQTPFIDDLWSLMDNCWYSTVVVFSRYIQ
jgi:hypothetical protein